jgi:threonine/homoserine/homoserine lactone efflux protein
LGFLAGLIGVIPPGLLNMTATKISINQGKAKALYFALGASLVVILQVYVAVLFSKYLNMHPEVIAILEKAAVAIFFILSFYFFFKARAEQRSDVKIKVRNTKSVLFLGVFLSSINIFPIPFYVAYSSFLGARQLFEFQQLPILSFVAGVAIGTFITLYLYTFFMGKMDTRGKAFGSNINYILGSITLVVAVITIIKIYAR